MLGTAHFTEPVQLDPNAIARFAVTVSVDDRGIAKTIRLEQDGNRIMLTPAEVAALAGYIK